ncbi:tissue-type plasminogen activator-like [Nematolebias whitei]|uniref:tissue-type plasminogen activator-like n=1 Tax=Nematolebias whitei TaxID=451745 RepID=UPI00189A5D92|nr:tissue-type plasminogen activator-like [Nematolebias whitei]
MNLFVIISVLAAVSVCMAFSQRPRKYKYADVCLSGDGSSYRGFVSKSSNGRKCLRWSSVKHAWSDINGIGRHNYCRNPDQRLKPWCYVQKRGGTKREYCDIPRCLKPTVKPTIKPTTKPTTTSPPPVDTVRTCGERSERRINKIVGGSFTPIESHPWVAALYHNRGTFLCGGSLISPCWVLTAAHCFSEVENTKLQHMSVYLGKSAINETDATREQSFIVDKLVIHEDYDESNYNNDIALLKIKSTSGACAVKTPSVRTVCLPPLYTRLPPGITFSIAGFGKQKYDSPAFSQLLKQADVRMLSRTECKREPLYKDFVTKNMICAASPDWSIDACTGDSGGPLVYEASGRMFLFGVVSWGDGCAAVNKPGVYTQVTNYNKWIAAKTGLPEYTKGVMYPNK